MAEIYVVASGKGGVGKSTFVVGVSKVLSELNKKVLVIDCDTGLRSLDLLLGYGERVIFDWGDIIMGNCNPDKAVIHDDVDFIAAPISFNEEFTGEKFRQAIQLFADRYDYILLDAPAGIDSGFAIAAAGADKAFLVTTPDCVCVRSCAKAAKCLDKMDNIKDKKLIINMFEAKPVCHKQLLNIDECIDETEVMLQGVVPYDRKLAFSSVTGEEADEFDSSAQAFYRIGRRITGERVQLFVE